MEKRSLLHAANSHPDMVRIGIIGLGNMGTGHAQYLVNNEVDGAVLTAVCDKNPRRLTWAKENLSKDIRTYDRPDDLIASKQVDAVLIATPHYFHPEQAIASFQHDLHVLSEKPSGVYTRQAREMNEVAESSGMVFGMMLNMRTDPLYGKVKELVSNRELGKVRRTNWIITDWYRPQSYYDSCSWRGTWKDEGGGVLLNQAPHQLDLWQWTTDMMPSRVRAFTYFGKYRDIEVEDDVTAFAEYKNGATGLFVTTTGEAPGTNRYEITGDRGKLVAEERKLVFDRLRIPEQEFNNSFQGGFGAPESWRCEIPIAGEKPDYKKITQNWVNAILHGEKLIAPGKEGIKSLTLSNAMLLSTWTDNWVDLPIDEELFEYHLEKQIRNSPLKKQATNERVLNVRNSF